MAKTPRDVADGRVAPEPSSGFSERLRGLMAGSTQAAFAAAAGISQAGLHKLLHGGEPNLGTLIALAKAGSVRIEWLATGRGEKIHDESAGKGLDPGTHVVKDFAFVPRYEVSASAGPGLAPLVETVAEQIAFRADWLREMGIPQRSAAVLSADGDSMEPLIPDGALMLVDTSIRDVRNGCIYVIVKDGDLLVKRVHRRTDGTISLISENLRYPAEEISPEQLDKLHVVGRVRWVGRAI